MSGRPSAQEPPAASRVGTERLVFADVLRTALVAMVIVHHAAQAYGPTGGTWPVEDPAQSEWFRPFYTVNAAIGLGLLFLLAGYFVPASCDRKGSGCFLRERWARIGVPMVFFALVVHLPLVYLYVDRPPLGEFTGALYESGWQGLYMHLWFLAHLLLYSAVYVGWRSLSGRFAGAGPPRRAWPPPDHAAVAGFVVGLALVTWVVRWWYPVDEWVPLLFVVPAEPAHLPQYVSLFTLGVMACRGDWLRRIPDRTGALWLGVGLFSAAAMYLLQGLAPELYVDLVAPGGFTGGSLVRSTWETLICVGLGVGLIVLCRRLFNRPGRLLAAMADASYAAYILHVVIVVVLQLLILSPPLPAVVKFALVAAGGVGLSFGVGHLSRGVPGLKVVLGTAPETPHRLRSLRPKG
ncbi:acyltransferase family protein [Planobispora siamensis]|uniref:Acyltransferase 3 domain-containing protein n=1 Tax=Planobispora siamensis TaxID=936338 RepID=A0A8J3WPK4_9ACTN|nr:acyltransferase family protein [Planobispora siamensis]GIH95792.1 hypothetical protein Psi01_64220 [Planobispora siamensis]